MSKAVNRYYHAVVALHWLIALLIIGLLAMGWWMADLPRDTDFRSQVYRLHKSFGLLVVLLVLMRVYWRLRSPVPAALAESCIQQLLAHITHLVIYLLMFFVPLIALLAGNFNRGFDFFIWHFVPLFERNREFSHGLMGWHDVSAYLLALLLGLHILAALWHQFGKRDHIFRRMWFY